MANIDPPAISTPSRPRYSLNPKRSGTFTNAAATPNVAGFSPGGQVFEGYSYLSRSTSMSTSTRSRPKGLQSRTSDLGASPVAAAPRNLPTSPTSTHISTVADSPPANTLPQRSKTISSSLSTPDLSSISSHPPRSTSESERLAEAVVNLPHNPKTWLPSQVALYLTHVLGLVPRPVVEDVTAYVRSSRMGGRAFLRLSEKDLERQGLNLKWRKLMIEAVRKLRRDALRGRIWGYESGSLRWPKSSQDVQREEADEEDQSAEDQDVEHDSKTTSKLTLKRMRDSRKVRGMIQAFQTSPEKEPWPLSNLSIDSGYGQGYVRGQAQQILSEAEEKKLSLRRPLRPRRSTADFPWLENVMTTKHEDVEALLAGLSEQEAQQLANELGLNDLNDTEAVSQALHESPRREPSTESTDDLVHMPTLTRHSSVDTLEGDSSLSECSIGDSSLSESELELEHAPRYGVLDESLVRSILEDDAPSPLTRSHTTASIVRPGRPYRASLYTDDELAALDNNDVALHTRTESSRELLEAGAEEVVVEPDFGTARLRSADEKDSLPPIPNFNDAPSSSPQEQTTTNTSATEEYIFTPPSPPPTTTNTLARTGSLRTANRKATFGSKRGKAVLSLLAAPENNDLFSSLPGASSLRHTRTAHAAEDEEGWGGTMGRTASSGRRRGLGGVFDSVRFGRKAHLERVASEAEGESQEAETEVEVPVARYEETVLQDDALERKASVEQRLGSLFQAEAAEVESEAVVVDVATGASEAKEEASAEVEAEVEAEAEAQAEVVITDQPHVVPIPAVEEPVVEEAVPVAEVDAVSEPAEVVGEPAVDEVLPTAAVDAVAEPAEVASEPVDISPTSEVDAVAEPAEAASKPMVEELSSTAKVDAVAEPAAPSTVDTLPKPSIDPETAIDSSLAPAGAPADPIYTTAPNTTFKVNAAQPPLSTPSIATRTSSTEEPVELIPPPPAAAADPQLLVPLTILEPHPSGTGSIKKRSMVLVDRKRFESLARRMTDLESQLGAMEPGAGGSSRSGTVGGGRSSGLRDIFSEQAEEEPEEEAKVLDDILAASSLPNPPPPESMEELEVSEPPSSTAPPSPRGWRTYLNPSSWASYLSSLNPYYSNSTTSSSPSPPVAADEELDLYALLGRPESDHERHLLSIGAIPAYMLGLGAGVGFVLVREVLGRH